MGSPHFALGTNNTFAACYAISKAGLNMVIAKFAAEQKHREAGLTIVGISPGLMKTATGRKSSQYVITMRCSCPTCPSYNHNVVAKEIIDKVYDAALARARAFDPNYHFIEPEDSAQQQFEVLEKLSPADSGTFMHWNGKKVSLHIFYLSAMLTDVCSLSDCILISNCNTCFHLRAFLHGILATHPEARASTNSKISQLPSTKQKSM